MRDSRKECDARERICKASRAATRRHGYLRSWANSLGTVCVFRPSVATEKASPRRVYPQEVHVEIVVKSKNCDVPSRVKEEAKERLAHATRFFDRVLGIEAVFAEEPNRRNAEPALVEVTARTKGHRIRAQASGVDYRTALDAAMTRLERQLKRYKTRMTDRRRRPAAAAAVAVATAGPPRTVVVDEDEPAPEGPRIVRSKEFALTPMLPEDAAWHLEMLGHDFYVFTNSSTGACNVLYRRRDGDLGLIETVEAGTAAATDVAMATG